ncbi:MAG: translocation and assembly module TamB [Paraglaciecola sp.]|jgi:translocation and assembly module TamB
MSLVFKVQKSVKKPLPTSNYNSKTASIIAKACLILVMVICFFVGFSLTPWGTKTIISTTNNLVDGLTIDYQRGSLGSELHLSSVKWKQPGSKVDIDNLRLSIQLSCLWRFVLCIDLVDTKSMGVQIKPTNQPPSLVPVTAAFTLPFPVSIKNLSLNDFSLNVEDMADITWHKLTGKVDFYQLIRIEKMQVDGFNLITFATKKSHSNQHPAPFDWSKWQYQPMTATPTILPLHFEVVAFDMSPASLQLAGQQKVILKKVSFKAKGSKKKVQVNKLFIEHEQGQLFAKGNVQLNGLFEHVFSVDADVQMAAQTPLSLTLRSSGNINSLSTQVELSETRLPAKTQTAVSKDKPLKLLIDLTAQPSQAFLPINIKLNWSHLIWPLAEPELSSETGVIDISGDLKALKLTIQTMLAGRNVPDSKINISAVATSTLANKSLELNEFLLETLGGHILSKGKLTFSEHINWQGNSVISQLDPSIFWPQTVADINGQVSTQANNSQGTWKAKLNKLDINGQWQGYPLSASGRVDFQQNKGLQLQALLLKNANNTLLLEGGVSKQKTLDIRFMLNAVDLSKTFPQLGGAINLSGNISGRSEQPEVSYELSGSQLLFSEVFIQQVLGKGAIKWNEQKPVELDIALSGIQGIDNQVDNAQIILSGVASDHQLDITTSGGSTRVNASIQGQLNQTSWQGNWLSGDIASSYASLTLLDPFKIEADWAKQQYIITPHCWRHTENALCIKRAEFKQNMAVWDVSLKEFDVLSLMHRLLPGTPKIQTQSRLDVDMSGHWNIEQLPNANFSASLSPGDWVFINQNNLQLTVDKMLVEAQISQKNILAEIYLSGDNIGTLSASLEGQSGVFADSLTRPIQGELRIERFDLSAFKALIPQLDVLQGDINGQAKIDGTLGSPLLTGDLTLANGALKDESLPVAISAIQQSISLKGQRAQFKGRYKLGNGQGQMNGDIAWMPALKGNLHISGEKLEFDYQNMIKAKVSPNINIMFEPNHLAINGEIAIPYARVKVRELPKEAISPSKDVILVDKQAQLNTSQQRLTLNILLKVDPLRTQQVKFDAFGLTTDLQGELRLQNNKNEYFGNGNMQLVNGRYRAYGQNLIIREGDVLFTSALDRPFLSIEAIRNPSVTSDSVVAGLRIEGVAQNPKISVFSEPVMEQQQILSYILTGRGLDESSGISQNTILTNTLLSLGLGRSENLISKVGNKLGFEDVNLDTSGQGDGTQLSLTGTLAPGVQLRYGVGVFDSISEVAIRYELMPKLYIEAVRGLGSAIDIYYQFSIEGSQNKRTTDD